MRTDLAPPMSETLPAELRTNVGEVALAYLAGGAGLRIEPGSPEWWLTRPLWIAALYALLPTIARKRDQIFVEDET